MFQLLGVVVGELVGKVVLTDWVTLTVSVTVVVPELTGV